jgi:hypothetical protein
MLLHLGAALAGAGGAPHGVGTHRERGGTVGQCGAGAGHVRGVSAPARSLPVSHVEPTTS